MSLNRIILQGRLGADPELRTKPSGTEVATVNIAVDRDRKDADGNRQSDWVTIVAWKSTAKFLCQYFQKGRVVIVDGRLQMRNWTDKDGNKRTSAEVVADNLYFGDSKQDPLNGQVLNIGGTSYRAAQADTFAELSDDDGLLPF